MKRWTWLYSDYERGTVFITDDPIEQQTVIADDLDLATADRIVEMHNAGLEEAA